jgi:hypothetical protein
MKELYFVYKGKHAYSFEMRKNEYVLVAALEEYVINKQGTFQLAKTLTKTFLNSTISQGRYDKS